MKLIKKTICLEPLKSRLPNLLTYISEDGLFVENVLLDDNNNGSWGNIMPNINVPTDIYITHHYDTIIGGKTYGYRRLMDLYYTILNEQEWLKDENKVNYITFIDKLNSIHRIDKSLFPKSCDIPFIIHSTMLNDFIQKLKDMKNEITLLQQKEVDSLTVTERRRLYHTIKRFKRKGGNKFIEYLERLPTVLECKELSNVYVDKTTYPIITTNVFIGCKENDLGYSELLLPKWEKGKKYFNGDMVLFDGETYICTCEEDNFSVGVFDSSTGLIGFDYNNFTLVKDIPSEIHSNSYIGNIHTTEPIEFEVNTHKQLKTLRYNKVWRDVDDIPKEPFYENEDWLAFYKIGIVDYNATKDKFGNIEHFGFDPTNGKDLILYGSGVSSIRPNEDFTELYIDYFINSHLIADFREVKTDSDGITKYFFENFRLDNETEYIKRSNGSTFTEKFYINKDSDLYKLLTNQIENVTFDRVVNDTKYKSVYKFEFYKDNEGKSITKKHIKTNKTDYLYGNLIKRESSIGISNQPKIKEYTDMDRGVANYAESHMVLGDIFSFEGMINYSNGGFFKIEKS